MGPSGILHLSEMRGGLDENSKAQMSESSQTCDEIVHAFVLSVSSIQVIFLIVALSIHDN